MESRRAYGECAVSIYINGYREYGEFRGKYLNVLREYAERIYAYMEKTQRDLWRILQISQET